MPMLSAARTTPVWPSVRWKCVRSCGATTATPISTADTLACAAVPTASTTQR